MQETSSLKRKTISGLFWSFADLVANQGIQFILQIILARLLLPEHFGLIAMIAIFIAISNSIIDSGFTQGLIREKDANQEDYSTAFYFNLFMAFVMYIVIFILADTISAFFGEDQLVPILKVLSLVLIFNSFGIIQRVLLIKKVDFRTQTKINIISGIISGIVGIIFALKGYGVWSLVVKTLLMQLIQSLLLCFFIKWIPSFVFNVNSFKRLFGFGSKLLVSGLIDTIYNNIYFIIIGRVFSTAQLGYYTNAVKLRDITSQSITASVQRVTYPVLSGMQEDGERLKHGFRKIIKTSAFINFPIMLGLAAIANPLIHLFYGDKWTSSILYFQLLCVAGMLYPLHAINLNILQVKGRSDLFLLLEIIKKSVLTVFIILSLWFQLGIIGLIWAAILNSFVSLFINTYFSAKEISYALKEQITDLVPIFVMTIFMVGVVSLSGMILPEGNVIKLVSQISIGIVIYVVVSKLAKIEELITIYGLFVPLFKRMKQKLSQ
ncbi:lipopolysaccharide biosynthesis protein [Peribacillus huizhouensis]|uniref:O-antigen/teichoic acid export membrane protein n=1 Tax=Peribacillus huizhouensis TaxID=1501239 RepID=A0ABR6CKY0_9BACI|nr:lipopolysaccharide biosynthesis protein [Peribacillus huizhouensis]MBA9025653.1 O-antigen/teichoic acid export membrane protein [Peribacillus huizhouensis]